MNSHKQGVNMNEANQAALNGLARQCNTELKQVDKQNLPLLKSITDRFAAKAKLIGFSKTELMCQIGRINKQLVDRRLDGY